MPLTRELTTWPNDAPITTPTARSTALPFSINCLKPLSTRLLYHRDYLDWEIFVVPSVPQAFIVMILFASTVTL